MREAHSMPQIRDILTNSTTDNLGLIPYLAEALGGEWDRFQLRPWDYKDLKTADLSIDRSLNDSGFRWGLVKWERKEDNRVFINQEMRVGYLLMSGEQLELQIAAAELYAKLAAAISTWSCCTDWAKEIVMEAGGGYNYSTNPTISSANAGGWVIAVIVEFELIYQTAIGVV
ncbi:MAG: hypothetical protein ACRC62_37745 [Microcoleus sp.]